MILELSDLIVVDEEYPDDVSSLVLAGLLPFDETELDEQGLSKFVSGE
jgi:hypothetical protein